MIRNFVTRSAAWMQAQPPDLARGRIWFTADQQSTEVVVRIRDTGIGSPAA
jgi:hypothetical protein